MAFLRNIKRAFGFDASADDDELYRDTAEESVDESYSGSADKGSDSKAPVHKQSKQPVATSDGLVSEIFDDVVRIFNESLPEFLRNSIDQDAQKKYIYENLDKSVKNYLEQMQTAARADSEARWRSEKTRLQNEAKEAEQKAREADARVNEAREKQLSADRQRRALSERIHDLEARIQGLEAEKEQSDLEVKSLLNKVKVAAVYEKDVEAMRLEISQLRQNPAAVAAAELDSYKKQAADMKQQNEELEAQLEAIRIELCQSQEHADKLHQSNEALKVKEQMSEVMFADLQSKCKSQNEILAVKDAEIAAKISEISAKNEDIASKDAIIENLNIKIAEIENATDNSDEIERELMIINEQLSKVEELKQDYETRIANLKQSVKAEQEKVQLLEKTVRDNLLQHAREEQKLRDALAAKKATEEAEEDTNRRRRPSRSKSSKSQTPLVADTSDVDDILGDTDWLVSTPPKGSSMRKDSGADADFGYQEPPRKPQPPINDAQMTLF